MSICIVARSQSAGMTQGQGFLIKDIEQLVLGRKASAGLLTSAVECSSVTFRQRLQSMD